MPKKHTNSENAIADICNSIQQSMDEKNIDLFVYAGKQKMPIINKFVLLFYNSFLQTINDYNLSRNEIRAILQIMEYMKFGNLINMSNSSLARDLNIDPRNMTRIMKKLKDSKLLITIEERLYLNPHIIAKGKFNQKDDMDMMLLDKAAEQLKETNISPSIETPKMRKNKILKNNNTILDI